MIKQRITPALNAAITNRAKKLCEETKNFTESNFKKCFNQAIKDFGHNPKTYHAHAKKYF